MEERKRERPKMAGTQQPRDPVNKGLGTLNPMNKQWLIHYSRFFNFPSLPSTCPTLIPLCSRCKKENPYGIWLASSLMASLHLIFDHNAHGIVLVVAFQGKTYEEHYISKLLFSWPQVSCLDECPNRGSRVIFASYRDSLGQVQKFAMHFSASSDSQTFISSLKESVEDIRNAGLTSRKFGSEISSPSKFISSNGIPGRAAQESGNVNHSVGNFEPPLQPQSNYESMQYTCCEGATLAYRSEATCATLPPSFTALLSDSCTAEKQEPSQVPEAFYPKTQMSGMTSSSFYDMLNKLEMVIEELGGDLAL